MLFLCTFGLISCDDENEEGRKVTDYKELVLTVASKKVPGILGDGHSHLTEVYAVKEEPSDEWSAFGYIDGFEFEPGYEYRIRISRTSYLDYSMGQPAWDEQKLLEVISKDKKEAIIGYLTMLSSFAMHAGLEIFNIVDYMSIIEVMQERDKRKDFIYSIDKHKSSFALSHPNFGGESYSDYGLVLTPLDFAWYLDGFSDTDSQREVFFSYYDSLMNEEEKSDEERYLEVLGLKKGATRDEIQKAYKDIVQRFHPDRISSLGLDPSFTSFANAQMQRANEAYDALKKMITS